MISTKLHTITLGLLQVLLKTTTTAVGNSLLMLAGATLLPSLLTKHYMKVSEL